MGCVLVGIESRIAANFQGAGMNVDTVLRIWELLSAENRSSRVIICFVGCTIHSQYKYWFYCKSLIYIKY